MIEEYLENRQNLTRTFMLVDLRHKPSDDDVLMYKYLKFYKIPVTIVATKSDKLSNNRKEKAKNNIIKTLELDENDSLIILSNVTKEGKDKILKEIEDLIGFKEETI